MGGQKLDPACPAGRVTFRQGFLRGRQRHVIYRWKALVLSEGDILLDFVSLLFWAGGDLKTLHSKIFDFVNFLQEKVRAVNFLAGRRTFESSPSCRRAVFLTSVEHCFKMIEGIKTYWSEVNPSKSDKQFGH